MTRARRTALRTGEGMQGETKEGPRAEALGPEPLFPFLCSHRVCGRVRGWSKHTPPPLFTPLLTPCLWHIRGSRKVVFGTATGTVAMLKVDASGNGRHGWAVPPNSRKAAVNVMAFHDISRDGVDDVVVGFADGSLTVFGFDTNPDQPQQQFHTTLDESISSVACGSVSSADYDEILCLGYSGKVVSFTNEPLNTKDASDAHGRTHATIQNENKIRGMQKELDEMKSKIDQTKTQYVAKSRGRGDSSDQSQLLAPTFDAKTSFTLDEESAAYVMNVELPIELNCVLLTSTTAVDLLDIESSTATVARSNPDPETSKNKLAACYRLVEGGSRLQMKMRTTEGEFGDMKATIVANTNPKSAIVVR